MKIRALALLLLASVLAAATVPAAAGSASFADRHDELAAGVNAALGGTALRIKPFVTDAQQRIADAIRDVGTHQQTPPQILDFGQKMALRRARRAHTEPDLNLKPEQRGALASYATSIAAAVAPIVRDDGGKIDALLTPDQRAALDTLRSHAREELRDIPQAAGMPDIGAIVAGENLANSGGFVLLVELDLKALMSALR